IGLTLRLPRRGTKNDHELKLLHRKVSSRDHNPARAAALRHGSFQLAAGRML
ncbi:Hypothetical predicted protein, partial [Marmota monax]